MAVDSVFFYRHAEHLAGGSTIDILSLRKYPGAPGLPREVCKYSGFNGGEVADNEFVSGAWYKGSADQLRQDCRYGVVEKL